MKNKDENHLINLVNNLQKTNQDLVSKIELKDQLMQSNDHMIDSLKQKAFKKNNIDSPKGVFNTKKE